MKVRVYGFEHYFEPSYDINNRLVGYHYGNGGWYGIGMFKRNLNNGVIKIIVDIKPKQKLKKLSFV